MRHPLRAIAAGFALAGSLIAILPADAQSLRDVSTPALLGLERRNDDVRFRPIYVAILTRNNLPQSTIEEAVDAIVALDRSTRTQALLSVLSELQPTDAQAAGRLIDDLLAQPLATLRRQRDLLESATAPPGTNAFVLRAVYGAMLSADESYPGAWSASVSNEAHLIALLSSVPHLRDAALRASLSTPIATLLGSRPTSNVRVAALDALGWVGQDRATFDLLARDAQNDSDAATQAAAIRSLTYLPRTAWIADRLEPLAESILTFVGPTSLTDSTDTERARAYTFAEALIEALPDATARARRRDLRGLGAQIVHISTVPNQVLFDLRWFVVEAGSRVQVVFSNIDGMPHNLVITTPGALEAIAIEASSMPMSPGPGRKAYVPDSPLVLYATERLVTGDAETLSFTAPATTGEYEYLCSIPGHYLRMYGVMLVVDSLEAWEQSPVPPTDRMTKQPFDGPRRIDVK